MATLLIVGNSEGSRRCDAKCHDAELGSTCDCCCGGRYHSLGSSSARDLTQEDIEKGRYGKELAELARYLTEEASQAELF